LRRFQVQLLSELVGRHRQDGAAALPAARQLVQIDPFNEDARAELLRLLLQCGRKQEAESHFDTAVRLYREIGQQAVDRLTRAWQQMRREPAPSMTRTPLVAQGPDPPRAPPSGLPETRTGGLFGRAEEARRLFAAVEEARHER